jgi:hypothetical protein
MERKISYEEEKDLYCIHVCIYTYLDFIHRPIFYRSRGSSVSIVSDYELDDRGSIPDEGRGFFF